jgi:DICT domain-containing protein
LKEETRDKEEVLSDLEEREVLAGAFVHDVSVRQEANKLFVVVKWKDKELSQRIPRHVLKLPDAKFQIYLDEAMTRLAKRAVKEGFFDIGA